ncbi:hypothetical protein EGN72_13465 [Pseudorhodobacter sp. E13]|uniref:hypothetical protein n=1 Tax=Pseudorhodobacter sp. E13 TaxID=2487931 RepID=UPI000F8E3429|nr:hypothetical protein [Pseudorhodobacter sp. E13]RUS59701.1 hypothetical protein EGN72_13465 [Pseudorhodobacter sp. E13]
MPDSTPQIEWLTAITGSAAKSAKAGELADQRKAAQDAMNLALPDTERAEIREALLGLSIKVKGKIGSSELAIMSADGNAMKEVDTVHHGAKTTEGLSAEDIKILNTQMDKIFAIQAEMLKNPAYTPPAPEFPPLPEDPQALKAALKERARLEAEYDRAVLEGQARLAEDLWLPLNRQGIIPENFIPQKHSAVAAQFKASSELYEDRLQDYSANLTAKDILKEKFEFGMSLGKASLKLMTAGVDLTGSIAEVAGDDGVKLGAEEATLILGHMATALSVVDKAGNAALSDRDFTSVGDAVAGAVSEIVAAQVGDDAGGKEIGALVGGVISSATRGVRTAQLLKAGDFAGAAQALADGIAKGLEGADNSDGKWMTALGAHIQVAVRSTVNSWNALEAYNRGGSTSDVLKAMIAEFSTIAEAAAKSTVGTLVKEIAETVKTDVTGKAPEDEKEKTAEELRAEALDEAAEKVKDATGTEDPSLGESWGNRRAAQKVIAAKFDMTALKALRDDAAKKQAEDMEALANEGDEEFRLALITGFAMPGDDDEAVNIEESNRLASIDYIMAVQAKNDATFALCKSIAEKGAALVVKLCPGASIVESCLTLTFTIQDAIAKTEELIIWQDNFKDAQRASSAQVDAFMNRKGLQTKQTLKAAIQVALDAAKVVAEVLKMTPAAPAAPIVTASINTTEALIEVAEIVATKAQMDAAWKVYVRARENPADRYLARKATQQNPTLAKYAMAWGATMGDPIAVEGMRRCGLNEHTLALPETNVAKVVAYLEAKYADDPILLRAVPVKQKWHPGKVELTLQSWASFYQMATIKAEPLVSKTNDISGINAAFGKLDDAEAAFSDAVDALMKANAKRTPKQVAKSPGEVEPAIVATLQAAIYTLRDVLRRFKSLDVDGGRHVEMASYVDALVALTETRLTAVDRVLDEAIWAKVSAA